MQNNNWLFARFDFVLNITTVFNWLNSFSPLSGSLQYVINLLILGYKYIDQVYKTVIFCVHIFSHSINDNYKTTGRTNKILSKLLVCSQDFHSRLSRARCFPLAQLTFLSINRHFITKQSEFCHIFYFTLAVKWNPQEKLPKVHLAKAFIYSAWFWNHCTHKTKVFCVGYPWHYNFPLGKKRWGGMEHIYSCIISRNLFISNNWMTFPF